MKDKLYYKLRYKILRGRLKIKEICSKISYDDQEWHHVLGMPSSEMTHIRRERESTYKTTIR
jgi:hypothetical protein